MKSVFPIMLLPLMFPVWAEPLVTLDDPSGDDHGNGALIYPQRSDFQDGDLDLRQLQISRDDEGFWFEAKFRNPIRDPSVATTTGESLAEFARKGFYQFNIDIYVDTDRVAGSGNVFTLPGRQVRIARDTAWEKAVILTPRPELMRQQLLDALAEQFPERLSAENEAVLDRIVYFPGKVRVRGRLVSFFVPAAFFRGGEAKNWAITTFITGAMTAIPADLTLFPSVKKPLERIQLGVMQPAAGHPKDTFGYSGSVSGPVVDLLAESTGEQERLLAGKSELAGVNLKRNKALVEQRDAGHAVAVMSLASLFEPETPAMKVPEAAPAEAGVPAEASIAQRLHALQQLYDQKLIDETEYREQRRRILNEL